MSTTSNQRTYEWADPKTVIQAVGSLSGPELAAGFVSGTVPGTPASVTLGAEIESAGDGEAVVGCTIQQWHCNTAGVVNGGVLSALADTAMAVAVLSKVPAGYRQTTLDLHVRFGRAVPITIGRLLVHASVKSLGKRAGVVECVIKDQAGVEYARGSSGCMLYADAPRA